MSIRSLDGSNFYTATPGTPIAPGTRTTMITAGYIPLFSAMNSFNPAASIDLDALAGSPFLAIYGDNGPNIGTINDDGSGTAGLSLAGLQASWFAVSVSSAGPHNGSFQTLRTGLNAALNTGSKGTLNTAASYQKVRLGTTGAGGNWNGRLLNFGVFVGLTDAQEDQARLWALTYWLDTLPAPFPAALKWSRRLSADLTTGFGTGNPVATGAPTISNAGDPAIAVYSASGPATSASYSYWI